MDHYSTLGVAKNATPDEIKKAYRKLASQHHPDKGGDTAMFQKIEEAYRILSDPEQKAEYDNPTTNTRWAGGGNPGGFGFAPGADMASVFEHIFGQHSGNPFHNQRPNKQLFRTQVTITLESIYNGASQILKIQTPTGQKALNIDIPKGLKENSQLRYDDIIDNATLMVEFRVVPHLRFDRRGNDLYCNHAISVLDLVAGNKFNFITISGKEFEVSVPPKTQPYMQLKIAGQGMPIQGTNQYGDQILLLKPYIPDIIDEEITQSILRSRTK